MKKLFANILIAATALTGLGLSSCADDLDMTPDGRMDLDQVFGNPDNVKYYFSQAWMYVPDHDWANYFFENFFIDMADEGWSTDDGQAIIINDIYKGNVTAEKHRFEWDDRGQGRWDGNYWKRYWETIRVLNMFLSRIDGATCESDAERRQLKAEAQVLRAFFYLNLAKLYGDIPLIEKPTDVNTSYSGMKRDEAWKVFQFCVSECEKALECDELPWRIVDNSNRNRMTKGIACAIISQASLFAASPLFCHEQELWKYALEKNELAYNLLKENGYELYTVCQDPKSYPYGPYQEYFSLNTYAGNNANDNETIWGNSQTYRAEGLYVVNGIPIINGNFKVGICPTQNLIDAYDMAATGKPIYDLRQPYQSLNGDPDEWDLTKPNIDPTSGYNEADPYVGRDQRFYANTAFHGATVNTGTRNKTVETYNNTNEEYGGTKSGKKGDCAIDAVSRTFTRTGFYNRKYHQFKENSSTRYQGGNWRYFRFGEVMLNYAEALVENNLSQKAMDLVNEIRHRAGFSPSVDIKPTSQDYDRLIVRHERQVELCFEEHRYYDVRRWGKVGEDIMCEKYKGGTWVTTNASGKNPVYHRFVLNVYGLDGGVSQACYEAKYRLVSIPLKEAQNMTNLSGTSGWQNYGW
ncbi:MAG: RagB/SusD family nutrient uptake outer membrane protein [Muribaculum sp.]|nr:RagB/SusD family nutrient uptake outer membrane protein [Muribaculaceae bacterium]MCM1080725.1 RagB/SusD family nutrient uptake outer membrane protein [Muribaculum sp.]